VFILKRVRSESDANDLTQQTFIKAMMHISKYEDRGLPFGAWLYRIALNESNMFFRKKTKNYMVELHEGHVNSILDEIESNGTSDKDQEKLIEILNQLNEKDLDLIELRFFQKLPFREISEIYNITEANAKMKLYRIIEKIKKNLKLNASH
jgi:RNA polymerase sigma-70 factor (ECF subfamily)